MGEKPEGIGARRADEGPREEVQADEGDPSAAKAGSSHAGTEAAKAATVKGSKSNTSERLAGTGSGESPGPAQRINLNSSKSNAYRSGAPVEGGPELDPDIPDPVSRQHSP